MVQEHPWSLSMERCLMPAENVNISLRLACSCQSFAQDGRSTACQSGLHTPMGTHDYSAYVSLKDKCAEVRGWHYPVLAVEGPQRSHLPLLDVAGAPVIQEDQSKDVVCCFVNACGCAHLIAYPHKCSLAHWTPTSQHAV
jgi:hypothetical protein